MTQEPQTDSLATRRGLLAGVGLVGLAGVVTACGGGGSSSAPAASTAAGQGASSAPAASSAASSAASGASAGNALAATSATQPTAGEFKAFSAICTHMGCIVSQVANGTIDCPCHGSQYSITTGAVVAGPAPMPLAAENIKVSGGSIFLE